MVHCDTRIPRSRQYQPDGNPANETRDPILCVTAHCEPSPVERHKHDVHLYDHGIRFDVNSPGSKYSRKNPKIACRGYSAMNVLGSWAGAGPPWNRLSVRTGTVHHKYHGTAAKKPLHTGFTARGAAASRMASSDTWRPLPARPACCPWSEWRDCTRSLRAPAAR